VIILPSSSDPRAATLAIALTRAWVEHAVIGLNLCPFARPVHVRQQIDYRVSIATDEAALSQDLLEAMQSLVTTPAATTDTCLLIHPWVLQDFIAYNDFLDIGDALLDDAGLTGVLQIASFHPEYRFAGTDANDVTNSTNRSPFPTLHLLRESSLDKATDALPDASDIVDRNLATLTRIGHSGWESLQQHIIEAASLSEGNPSDTPKK
jgi:uncharacterized protein